MLSSAPRATSEQQQLSPAVAQFSAVGEALAPMCKSRLLDARFYELHSRKLLQFDDLVTISQAEIESMNGFFLQCRKINDVRFFLFCLGCVVAARQKSPGRSTNCSAATLDADDESKRIMFACARLCDCATVCVGLR